MQSASDSTSPEKKPYQWYFDRAYQCLIAPSLGFLPLFVTGLLYVVWLTHLVGSYHVPYITYPFWQALPLLSCIVFWYYPNQYSSSFVSFVYCITLSYCNHASFTSALAFISYSALLPSSFRLKSLEVTLVILPFPILFSLLNPYSFFTLCFVYTIMLGMYKREKLEKVTESISRKIIQSELTRQSMLSRSQTLSILSPSDRVIGGMNRRQREEKRQSRKAQKQNFSYGWSWSENGELTTNTITNNTSSFLSFPSSENGASVSVLGKSASTPVSPSGYKKYHRNPSVFQTAESSRALDAPNSANELDMVLTKMRLFLERFSSTSITEAPKDTLEVLVALLSDATVSLRYVKPEFMDEYLAGSYMDSNTRQWLEELFAADGKHLWPDKESSSLELRVTNEEALLEDEFDSMQSIPPLKQLLQYRTPTMGAQRIDSPRNSSNESADEMESIKTQRTKYLNKLRLSIIEESVVDSRKEKLTAALEKVDSWNEFDVFLVNELTEGRPMPAFAMTIMERHRLFEKLPLLRAKKCLRFFERVNDGYRDLSYHNIMHATDVTQAAHCMILDTCLNDMLRDLDVLALLIASMVHDYDHPGLNNSFLIQTNDELAIKYNDVSVLENHHVSQAMRILLLDEECSFLESFSKADRSYVRRAVVRLVLSTDLGRHIDLLNTFKSEKKQIRRALQKGIIQDEDRFTVMDHCLKCADINHPARPREIHLKWNRQIHDEFYAQGDIERELGMEISAFMDRRNPLEWKSQVNFMDFLVLPQFETYGEFVQNPKFSKLIEKIREHKNYWYGIGEIQKEESNEANQIVSSAESKSTLKNPVVSDESTDPEKDANIANIKDVFLEETKI